MGIPRRSSVEDVLDRFVARTAISLGIYAVYGRRRSRLARQERRQHAQA